VNDRFGHLEGNRILRLAAEKFRECCRPMDYVARMGGDEFVIVLPGVGQTAALEVAGRLRRMLEKSAVEILGQQVLSMSVGAAWYPDDGVTTEAILAAADRAMYREKRARKDLEASLLGLNDAVSADARPVDTGGVAA
jgi:diguanylate cyclase (GGDEF)-like protein